MIGQKELDGLKQVRVELEQSVGPRDWPQAARDPLLLLRDVCGALSLSGTHAVYVLGEAAWHFVNLEVSAPVTMAVEVEGKDGQ